MPEQDWLHRFVDWLTQHVSPRYSAVVTLGTGFLLFAPPRWLASFRLDSFAQAQRSWIALAFLFSGLFTASFLITVGWNYSKRLVDRYRGRKALRQAFESLGIDQLMILQRYVESGKIAIAFELRDAAVQDSVHRKILYRPRQQLSGRISSRYYEAEFCVQSRSATVLASRSLSSIASKTQRTRARQCKSGCAAPAYLETMCRLGVCGFVSEPTYG